MIKLCELLESEIPETSKLPLLLQVAIFLDWICFGQTYRQQRNKYKLSHKLIKVARRNVAGGIVKKIYPLVVKQPRHIPDISTKQKKKRFQGAFGCIDGCHVPLNVPAEDQRRWRNRKGNISTNVLAMCTLDTLLFTYVLVGAEGSAPDSGVLAYADRDINWILGGFLLADAGYGLSRKVLTPYRGVRYHLREFSNTTLGRPQNAKELFNLRHSSMRSNNI